MIPARAPRKILAITDTRNAPTTASGHRRIARPAKGIHIVSKKGPSRPIRSRNNRFQPLKSMYGTLHNATNDIIGTSTMIPRIAATIASSR